MSAYNPPIEDITEFNTSLFNQPEETLSQAEADRLYLSKTSNDTSSASLTTFTGAVNVSGNEEVGTNAGTNYLGIRGEQRFYDKSSPYTNYARIFETGTSVIYESPNITAGSFHIFKVWSGGTLSNALELQNYQIVTRLQLSLTDKLEFNPAGYSFPYGNAGGYKYLGHNFKNTGGAFTTLTSGNIATILTSPVTLPVGVWRVDFSVQNTTGATGGTITNAQSYIATSTATTTPLAFTGALVRSYTSETYATGDVSVITSSFTLNVSTPTIYVLRILRTFAGSPNFTFIGEMSFTRIA